MIKIKGNEKLFNDWIHLKWKIQHLAGMVQNDMEIEQEELEEWLQDIRDTCKLIKEVRADTMLHIYKSNPNLEER